MYLLGWWIQWINTSLILSTSYVSFRTLTIISLFILISKTSHWLVYYNRACILMTKNPIDYAKISNQKCVRTKTNLVSTLCKIIAVIWIVSNIFSTFHKMTFLMFFIINPIILSNRRQSNSLFYFHKLFQNYFTWKIKWYDVNKSCSKFHLSVSNMITGLYNM